MLYAPHTPHPMLLFLKSLYNQSVEFIAQSQQLRTLKAAVKSRRGSAGI